MAFCVHFTLCIFMFKRLNNFLKFFFLLSQFMFMWISPRSRIRIYTCVYLFLYMLSLTNDFCPHDFSCTHRWMNFYHQCFTRYRHVAFNAPHSLQSTYGWKFFSLFFFCVCRSCWLSMLSLTAMHYSHLIRHFICLV